jgi:DNA-binding LacI/PurR family transcriptional regulator
MAKEIDLGDRTPLYEQIVRDIRAKVERGELKPGEQIWTQQELAAKYGVSLITVKNALAYLVNEGVLFARVGRGTFVAEKPVRKISLSPHRTLGLVLRDLKHPYFSMIAHSVEERAYELGFNVLLSGSSGDIEKEENQINHFRAMGVDGLIIASLSLEYRATEYIQKLHNEGFPYIMVSYIHDPEYWYVGSDHEQGGYMATEHLIKTGYKSVGYVHVGKGNLLSEVRKNGYYRALTEYGLPFRADQVYVLGSTEKDSGEDRYHLGYRFGGQFKSLKDKPEALFFYNDIVALGFLQGSGEAGIRVPDDVAIMGFDDSLVARYAAVPLSTIHQPVDTIGRHAVEILQKRIDRMDVGSRTILKPTLIIRESCGAKRRGALNPQPASLASTHE